MYIFDCSDIKIEKEGLIAFSADAFPLEQNCDLLELYQIASVSELKFFYDDGTKLAIYSPAFNYLFIDSKENTITFYLLEENRIYNESINRFDSICIRLKTSELLARIEKYFIFDKMICAEVDS